MFILRLCCVCMCIRPCLYGDRVRLRVCMYVCECVCLYGGCVVFVCVLSHACMVIVGACVAISMFVSV